VFVVRNLADRLLSSLIHVALSPMRTGWTHLHKAMGRRVLARAAAANFTLRESVRARELMLLENPTLAAGHWK
jgi:hypothetical protein